MALRPARRWLLPLTLAAAGLFLGCSGRRGPALGVLSGSESWEREVKRRGLDPAQVVDPLATTEAMRQAAARLAVGASPSDRLAALQDALTRGSDFTFDYDAEVSLTAAQAFESRRGNCVAFTNLFIALARARGLPVRAALLVRAPLSEREGDLVFINDHVVAVHQESGRERVFDFYRLRRDAAPQVRLLDDLWVAAIYHNNRAVARLRDQDLVGASDELQVTLRLAPDFAGAWGNLGVVLRRRGDRHGAIEAYRRALAITPRNPAVLRNLATLHLSLGRPREAQAALDLANLGLASPHEFLVRGDLEAADGRPDRALRYYKRAKTRDASCVEAWIAVARTELELGGLRAARHALEHASALAPDHPEVLELEARVHRLP